MIPKIIHYCWFGGKPKPELTEKCIASWKEYCPDYKIIEWNEDNFNVELNAYVKEAYEAKKYAFVTDYVRLYVLFYYGGIYMDTDVMVLKNLDQFLQEEAYSGFETKTKIQTGLIASKSKLPLFAELLEYYADKHFILADGSYDLTTNVITITNMMIERGFIPNGKKQVIGGLTIYPQKIFCPDHKKLRNRKYMEDTVTIHYFAGSWKSEANKVREKKIWWRLCVKPAMLVSFILRNIFGKRWEKAKHRIFKKIYNEG